MVLENYEIALIGLGSTIVGVLIGALLSYHLSRLQSDRIHRLAANQKLINIFTSELSDVYPTKVKWPENIDVHLKSKFSNLQAAIGEFRFYLPQSKWESFDKAWFNYYCSTGRDIDKGCESYLHYMDLTGSSSDAGDYVQDGHENLVKSVNRVLAFAK